MMEVIRGVMLPFAGTSLGAALVFFMDRDIRPPLRQALTGFAAGVMVAASVWSLLLPALGTSGGPGSALAAAGGLWLGAAFLLALDRLAQRLLAHRCRTALSRNAMLMLAVTLHNLPEGMAVGVACGGLLSGRSGVTALGMLSLSLGIAIQNLPEGAIISLPLRAGGMDRPRAFAAGVLSGAVEPVGAVTMILLMEPLAPAMPWFLSFAAGAMLYVVIDELLPGMREGRHAAPGMALFFAGFTLMMALDVLLG